MLKLFSQWHLLRSSCCLFVIHVRSIRQSSDPAQKEADISQHAFGRGRNDLSHVPLTDANSE